jgi:hypothetical protein
VSTKARDIDIAARAEFEAMKCVITELEGVEWEALPETDGMIPTGRSKDYYRSQVSTGVEALWRAGRLAEAADPTEDHPAGTEGRAA